VLHLYFFYNKKPRILGSGFVFSKMICYFTT